VSELQRESEPDPLHTLTTKQRQIIELIDAYQQTTGEPCTGHYLARRLACDPMTIRGHLAALYRKGWLHGPGSPATLRSRRSLQMPR
jgi:DNA-binding MarR family transcriptional regulator